MSVYGWKRIPLAVCALLILTAVGWSGRGPTRVRGAQSANGTPAGLTARGRLLWNFEALLKQTFGRRQVCTSSSKRLKTRWNFTAGLCAPMSTYSSYWFVFARPRSAAFHISRRRGGSLYFGNYPESVLIKGWMVTCNVKGTRFLIDYSDAANLTLGCLSPQAAPK